ncbi:chemotaxis protein CheB [Streptomyces sp. NPDC127108]|uniref:chemotaxis protein CheB n=1 Tax=Streptomyces sp. NPDC127108 TaxID=3345361 RepID=UPI0036295F49
MDEDSQGASEDDARAPFATVLVASSAGGIPALRTLLGGLDAALPVPVLVAQHLHRSRETRITAILSRATALTVTLAQGGETPLAGTVYIAPPDRHLCVRSTGRLGLTQEGRVHSARPAADPLFASAAQTYGPRVIACVLTGADDDGAQGVKAVRTQGGTVIVQDPETAEFHGMPRAAITTGQVDHVLPLDAIAPALSRLLRIPGPERRLPS